MLKSIAKSAKLANVCYDIRGPVLDKARQMEDEGQKIIKLNIGNIAAFGLEPPDEIVQDMIRNLPHAAGYTDSKGLFAPRKSVVHYSQEKHIAGVARTGLCCRCSQPRAAGCGSCPARSRRAARARTRRRCRC